MQLALLANPKSGAGRSVEEIEAALRGTAGSPAVTAYALDEANAAAASGADRVVVAGGDGSIGPAFAACAEHGAPLAILPAGTANDFARAVEVPADFDDAVRVAGDPQAPARPVWGASLDGHPFVNVASIGLAVNAAREAAPLKAQLGPVAYAIGALIAAAKGRSVQVTITVDEKVVFAGRAWQVLVASSGAFGGVAQLPTSDHETPEIEAFVVHDGSRPALVRRLWGMRHGDRGGVETFQGRTIAVDVPDGQRWNVDGEILRLGPVTATPLGPVEIVRPATSPGSAA